MSDGFEIRVHDGLGRIGKLTINNKSIITPNIAVVVNPNDLIITPEEMEKEFGVDLIITNAYIIRNSKHRKMIESKGLHDYFNFNGLIYTDSGTYQMFSKGEARITNEETLSYQELIRSDIITPLDVFTLPTDNKIIAKNKLNETIKRIKKARGNYTAPIQGGLFKDLRAKASLEVSKLNAVIYPIGGIVPLMINYQYKELISIIMECKKNLSNKAPVHAFGAGHPALFPLLAYAGIDLFDSASYALYAKQGRYLTPNGTKLINELTELPCNCPVCINNKPRDLATNIKLLAKHNLHVIMNELRVIREAIRSNKLFDLVNSRAKTHPALHQALKQLLKHKELINKYDPIRKRSALFVTDELSKNRPEITYAMNKLRSIGYKLVPKPLSLVYPFGQSVGWNIKYLSDDYSDEEAVKIIINYQFGRGAGELMNNVVIKKSRNNRIREVMKNNELLFVIRAKDGYASLQRKGALLLKDYLKKVFVNEELRSFYEEGGDVFAKHVINCSDDIKPREEVGVFINNELIAYGEAVLSSKEMIDINKGVAVKVRGGIKT